MIKILKRILKRSIKKPEKIKEIKKKEERIRKISENLIDFSDEEKKEVINKKIIEEFDPLSKKMSKVKKPLAENSILIYTNLLNKLERTGRFNINNVEETLELIKQIIGDKDPKGNIRSVGQIGSLVKNYLCAIQWKLGDNKDKLIYDSYHTKMIENKNLYENERAKNTLMKEKKRLGLIGQM